MARPRRRGRNIDGILVLDKASGISSNAALQEVKRLFNANKAGHTGSLDPLATGILPLCLGEATKLSGFLLEADKRYHTQIRFGIRTASGDADGEVIAECGDFQLSRDGLDAALERFRGEITQLPPMHSAVKIDGVPLYKLAREGRTIEREPRRVTVHHIAVTDFAGSSAQLDIACSKGTYVRAIADDLGQLLGCGAHVTALRRTGAGDFRDEDGIAYGQLEAARAAGGFEQLDAFLQPPDRAVSGLPEVRLTELSASLVRRGQAVVARHPPADGLVRLYDGQRFMGIGQIADDGRVAPRRLIRS